MLERVYQRLMRFGVLRTAQWFYKSEPSRFTRLTQEGPACPACAAPATHSSDYPSRKKPFSRQTVLYCTACGLGFVPSMAEVLREFYKRDYADSNRGDREVAPAQYFEDLAAGETATFAKYTNRVKRQIRLLKKNGARFGRVLDYGSGPGYFLQACGASEPHAVEPDERSQKYLHHIGATIHDSLDSLPQAAFDTIVASHSIEHLPSEELNATLVALLGALAPDGRLLIEVPQGGHSHLHLAGHRQDPHTLFFTGQALSWALRLCGAEVVFQKALGVLDSPRRKYPIYTPRPGLFYETRRGALTLICKKKDAA
jgi:SAM-dependent methyltransferase